MVNYSKLLNSNFLLKIGRCLYGYSGACRLLGSLRLHQLIEKALRCKKQVFRFWSRSLGLQVSFYAK